MKRHVRKLNQRDSFHLQAAEFPGAWVCMLLLMILTGCATQSGKKWHVYDAGQFSFSMPSSFQKTPARGDDSYYCEFTNEEMVLNFDYVFANERYPMDRLRKVYSGYLSHTETIDGLDVQIATFDGDLHYPEHFNHNITAGFSDTGLSMYAACAAEADYDTALKIFRSLKFKKPGRP